MKEESLEDADDLPEPEELATDASEEMGEAVAEMKSAHSKPRPSPRDRAEAVARRYD